MVHTAVKRWWSDLPVWKLWRAQIAAESRCDATAISPVGAAGLVQFMPKVGMEWAARLNFDPMTSPHDAKFAIPAGAAFMASLRYQWRRDRKPLDAHWLATASYNRGIGNILADQKECAGAKYWEEIRICTATHTMETVGYNNRIKSYWLKMESEN